MAASRHYLSVSPLLLLLLGAAQAPVYTSESVVSAASFQMELAPNSWVTIFGQHLSQETASAPNYATTELRNVTVTLNARLLPVAFVSPGQVNFRIPEDFTPGPARIQVRNRVWTGPLMRVEIAATAPALFADGSGKWAIATRPESNELVTPEKPAQPGEILSLWATGLGPTRRQALPGGVLLEPLAEEGFEALLDGVPLPVWYAGLAPGIPGLYQVNVELPGELPPDPPLRLKAGGRLSPESVLLPTVRSGAPGATVRSTAALN